MSTDPRPKSPKALDPIAVAFGERVRQIRLDRRWGLREMARTSGLDASWLSMIENGHRGCSISSGVRIAGALGVPLEDLVRDLPPS